MRMSSKSLKPETLGRCLFGVTLVLFIVASLIPQWRIWGFSALAHVPVYLSVSLVLAGLLIAFAEYRWSRTSTVDQGESGETSVIRFALWALVVTVTLGVASYLLRGRTHFLGDGYLLIHELAKNHPLIKSRELGEGLVHLWLRDVLGGAGLRSAELSYQLVSVLAGVAFAALSSFGAALLFTRFRDRIIFLLGLLSGGYALMFFGYAENYSLFCLSILSFTLTGLLITQQRVNRWVILAPLTLAVFFHVLGAVFVPAALYLLCRGTYLGNRWEQFSPSIRRLITVGTLVSGILMFGYLYTTDLYFQFAFVPLTTNQFSIPDYTIFSVAHVADLGNMLFLLLPGLLLVVPLMRLQPLKKLVETSSSRFLLSATIPALLAAALLDPKLGMARDWDLFSFPGVPLVTLIFWSLLNSQSRGRGHVSLAVLTVSLGFLILVPRAVVQAGPETGIALFEEILNRDHDRGRTGMFILGEYYREQGDIPTADSLVKARLQQYPYETIVRKASAADEAGRAREADALTRQALQMNPTYWMAWFLLSKSYFRTGQNDSALFAARVADGLNPYNMVIQNQMALANFNLGKKSIAARMWRDLVDRDTTQYLAAASLARLYQNDGNLVEYRRYSAIAVRAADATPAALIELSKMALRSGNTAEAAEACRRILEKGADSSKVYDLARSNPQLATLLNLPGRP